MRSFKGITSSQPNPTMEARSYHRGPSPFRGGRCVVSLPTMKPEPAIFDVPDDAHDARRLADALADAAAGRVISHAAMKAWLLSLGTSDELPPPQVGD